MKLTERTAYIKGLAAGLRINPETSEGKLITELIGIVGDMAVEIERLNDYVEELDQCLGEVEDFIAEECDCDCDCDDCNDCDCDDCDCDDCDCDEYYEAECPSCNKTFRIDMDDAASSLDDAIVCPHCGQKLMFDESELDEDGTDDE